MNKPIPLYVVLLLLVIALIPAVYMIGYNQGQKGQTTNQPVSATNAPTVPTTASANQKNLIPEHANMNPGPRAAKPMQSNATLKNLAKNGAKKFSHFRVGNRNIKSLYSDDDTIWVGTSGGVIRYQPATDEHKFFDVNSKSLLSNGVFHLNKIGDQILVGTYGGGLSIFHTKTKTWRNINIPQGLADQFVYDSHRMPNGDLWVATWSGVNLVKRGQFDNPKAWITYNKENTNGGLPNDWVYGVEADSQGGLWFATEEGVARFVQGKWTNWQHKDGVGAPYEQVKNDLKFSADPAMGSKHHARQKKDQGFSRFKGAYNANYIVALEVAKDVVWAGTWGGGLAKYESGKWTNYTSADGLPSNHVFTIFYAPSGDLWVGTSHGLAKFVEGKFIVYTKQHGLFADNVFSLAMAKDGTLWAGSFGGVASLQGLTE